MIKGREQGFLKRLGFWLVSGDVQAALMCHGLNMAPAHVCGSCAYGGLPVVLFCPEYPRSNKGLKKPIWAEYSYGAYWWPSIYDFDHVWNNELLEFRFVRKKQCHRLYFRGLKHCLS